MSLLSEFEFGLERGEFVSDVRRVCTSIRDWYEYILYVHEYGWVEVVAE